jgi:rhodanese-related sulfurtransferase/peroxiredoxin
MLRDFIRFSPIPTGEDVPPLSLTADEGTWIKIRDFAGVLNVVIVFVHHLDRAESESYFADLNRNLARFDELDTQVFVVSALRPEQLRKHRQKQQLDFFFVYDPLALSARSWGAAGRIRPHARDTTFLVGKDQCIHLSEKGFADIERLVQTCEKLEGREAQSAAKSEPNSADTSSADTSSADVASKASLGNDGQVAVTDIDSLTAEKMLLEKDSLYQLIDVRTQSEFEADHSPLATRIAVDEIPHRYQEIGQDDYLIFVCQAGGRSAAAAEFMVSIGAKKIFNVMGGMSSWQADRTNAAEQEAEQEAAVQEATKGK